MKTIAMLFGVGLMTGTGLALAQPNPLLRDIERASEEVLSGTGSGYDPAGRRDPFVNPLAPIDPPPGPDKAPGIAGMLLAEVRLVGISVDGLGVGALVLGSDGVGYTVREGDRLRDAQVVSIDFASGAVRFQQRVDDPTQDRRFRTVTRLLEP